MSGRYVVFGAGGVGGAAAVLLHQAGVDVRVVARGAQRDAIAAGGLTLRMPEREHRARMPVALPTELVIDPERDVILLAVKSQDTAIALEQIARAGGTGATIVCAQNGIANEPAAARISDRVGAAMVWTPAVYLSPGLIECYAKPVPGLWILGAWPEGRTPEIDRLSNDLERAGMAAPVADDIMRFKHAKLLDNLGNGVDALFDLGPGRVDDDWRAVLDTLSAEGEACLHAAGLEWAARAELDAHLAGRVAIARIGETRRPGGSTWQSLARGATRLELDYLNGEVCMLGLRHAVPTPYNRAVLRVAAEALRTGSPPRSADRADLHRALRYAAQP